jgi:hypothetical protein
MARRPERHLLSLRAKRGVSLPLPNRNTQTIGKSFLHVILNAVKNPEIHILFLDSSQAQSDKGDALGVKHLSRKAITQLDAFYPLRLAARSTSPTVGKETVTKLGSLFFMSF